MCNILFNFVANRSDIASQLHAMDFQCFVKGFHQSVTSN